MRAGVLCSAVVLTLLVVLSDAVPAQGDGVVRYNRRPTTTDKGISKSLTKPDDPQPTFRPRGARHREEEDTSSKASDTRSQVRGRSRSRYSARDTSTISNDTPVQSQRNEQIQSRRLQSRTKNRVVNNDVSSEKPSSRENIIRSRQNLRRNQVQSSSTTPTYTTTKYVIDGQLSTVTNDNKVTQSNENRRRGPTEATINKQLSNENEKSSSDLSIDRSVVDDNVTVNQYRRSTTQRTVENLSVNRSRGRARTKALDLEVSGTTNTMTASTKEQTTMKTHDLRNSRRLRYKTRSSETDTNLTGDGIPSVAVTLTRQPLEDLASQKAINLLNFTTPSNTIEDSSDKKISDPPKRQIVIKRPVSRDVKGLRNTKIVSKSKVSDEINEDDNYPESFKALLQTKNATQISSPSVESLSVKASQKVSKTHLPPTTKNYETGPDKDNVSRLRNKFNKEQETETVDSKPIQSNVTSYSTTESSKNKYFGYKPRGSYTPRNKNQNSFSIESSSTIRPTSVRAYKFSRKFKASTTPIPNTDAVLKTKRVESNSQQKKTVIRSSLFTRKNNPFNANTEGPVNNRKNDRVQNESFFRPRSAILPRTSFYSKPRNSSLAFPLEDDERNYTDSYVADKKADNSSDIPLIYTSTNNSKGNKTYKNFNINLNEISDVLEAHANHTVRDTFIKSEESENNIVINTDVTTQKYHANYKAKTDYPDKNTTATPPLIRNFRTKNYERKPTDSPGIFKIKERQQRKYSDKNSKTTEIPGNSIAPEPEKPKNKFSSKYRASYIDKPFYKPTVPTVTPSTAWLKFFVTDHLQLTKIAEQSLWFGDEFFDVTTEMTSRTNTTSPTMYHESSLEPVEGEEIQLGPDVNAIAFTKTRGQLSSADLRLSESLAKPLQVLNVEASNHSPSVTVSIFDALADILTSTPKPRLSSTTEVQPKQNVDKNVILTLDGVSSKINVNIDTGFANKDSVTTAQDFINTSAKIVQTTESFKPNVFNSLPVGENVTPSFEVKIEQTFPISPVPTSTPTPTTPISARKPFAIRVLYFDNEPPKDKTTTAAITTNLMSTDNPTMVYNTVSDLLLSNNGLVSSGLTSMLTSNIKSIIDSMDEESKSKLSVDMTKLFNSLIPEALRKTHTTVLPLVPETTPYSMEDINDTANINIDNNKERNQDVLQVVGDDINIVNSKTTQSPLHVNTLLAFEPQDNISQDLQKREDTTSMFIKKDIEIVTLPNSETIPTDDNLSDTTDEIPFLLNRNSIDTQVQSPLFIPNIATDQLDKSENTLQNLTKVSDLELWILTKKARVLKMIEDILREHNDEIANRSLQNLNMSSISFSNRFSEIIDTMSQSTETTDLADITMMKDNLSTVPPNSFPIFVTSSIDPLIQDFTTTTSSELFQKNLDFIFTTQNLLDISKANSDAQILETTSQLNEVDENLFSTTVSANNKVEDSATESLIENIPTTQTENNDDNFTTENIINDSTAISMTTENDQEITQTSGIKSTTASVSQGKSSNLITVSNQIKMTPLQTIPKKDYVIFGILPNNTVVRKDPNDNPLETLTEASPYIIYGVLPNNTIIRRFPNGTRVPQIMPKIDVLPISPWSLRNPYSPIHNIPAIVRPQSNPIRDSSNTATLTDTSNNEKGTSLTIDTVNNLESMIPSSALNIKDSRFMGLTTPTQPPAEKSTASHVLSLRTTTMLPSIDEILLNSISLATKEEKFISAMTSSTPEPRILTLDIDPETKQIRTEKPDDKNGNTVFKFIPIEDVSVTPQESNVLRLALPKNAKATDKNTQITTIPVTTEFITQTPQIQTNTNNNFEITTNFYSDTVGKPFGTTSSMISEKPNIEYSRIIEDTVPTTESQQFSTVIQTTPTTITTSQTTVESTTVKATTAIFTTDLAPVNSMQNNIELITSSTPQNIETTTVPFSTSKPQSIPLSVQTERSPKQLPGFNSDKYLNSQADQNAKLLQALLLATDENKNKKVNLNSGVNKESTRTIEEELKQFEEDTKLLKALLQATGRNPDSLNIPSFSDIKATLTTTTPPVRTTTQQTTSTTQYIQPSTEAKTESTFQPITKSQSSIENDIKKLQEDTLLLQALLKATGNQNENNMPIISGLTSNVRMSSKILTTPTKSVPTTPLNIRPVYTTTQMPLSTTTESQVITISTFQPSTEDIRISTTFQPFTKRMITSTVRNKPVVTTEVPTSSTFSDIEDLQFLQNLKSVLNTKNNIEDPETALANRVIALAVERSLNEIQVGKRTETTKVITSTIPPTTTRTTTTRPTTTTTTLHPNTPSIEDDIKQFEQDTKLLQALLKATGREPSQLNLPTLPNINTSASNIRGTVTTTSKPYAGRIAVKDNLRNEKDDAKLLQTLKQLQDVQETTTVRSKIAITGHTSDEALKKLIQKGQSPGMMSEATKSSVSLSTEYGNSNDALLAALLKEQGFGPTTASSLDEQLRLAALLNQVVVTPKIRRTTTAPPPPAQRRPILDGLAWLWQQWRDTAPGSAEPGPTRPAASARPQSPSTATSSRVNWFGSGPFVGNADERPASNRIPLEPPSAVSEQAPGRGQLVSAAINVTRAFSQFLGAAIQGAAKTVQNVIRAGQKAASDAYTSGSGPPV